MKIRVSRIFQIFKLLFLRGKLFVKFESIVIFSCTKTSGCEASWLWEEWDSGLPRKLVISEFSYTAYVGFGLAQLGLDFGSANFCYCPIWLKNPRQKWVENYRLNRFCKFVLDTLKNLFKILKIKGSTVFGIFIRLKI
jgi:hypothetical protein